MEPFSRIPGSPSPSVFSEHATKNQHCHAGSGLAKQEHDPDPHPKHPGHHSKTASHRRTRKTKHPKSTLPIFLRSGFRMVVPDLGKPPDHQTLFYHDQSHRSLKGNTPPGHVRTWTPPPETKSTSRPQQDHPLSLFPGKRLLGW